MRWCARLQELFVNSISPFLGAFARRVLFPFPPAADVDADIDQIRDDAGHALGDDAENEPADATDGADEKTELPLLGEKPCAK